MTIHEEMPPLPHNEYTAVIVDDIHDTVRRFEKMGVNDLWVFTNKSGDKIAMWKTGAITKRVKA
jgi:hypothetical protein